MRTRFLSSALRGVLAFVLVAALVPGVALAAPASVFPGVTALMGYQGQAGGVSEDGRYVLFTSKDALGGFTPPSDGAAFYYVLDRDTRTYEVVLDNDGVPVPVTATPMTLSADGRHVAFGALEPLTPNDTNIDKYDAYVFDLDTKLLELVSVSSGGVVGTAHSNNPDAETISLSRDGQKVAFASLASNLVAGDTNNAGDVFLRDRVAKTTVRVSVSSTGGQTDTILNGGGYANWAPSMSSDGTKIAFNSYSSNVVPGDTNSVPDIYLRDVSVSTTERISDDVGLGEPDMDSYQPWISYDGRYVVFSSYAEQFVETDLNGMSDIYLWDRTLKTMTLVSGVGGTAVGGVWSDLPVISGDGSTIAFMSGDAALVPGDDNSQYDILAYDVATQALSVVSVGYDGSSSNGWSGQAFGPSMVAVRVAGDGSAVLFPSVASNLVEGTTPDQYRPAVYLRADDIVLSTPITDADVTIAPTTFVYDGTAKEPVVTVVVGGVTLVEGTDYTVTYADNVQVGTGATATIVGIGAYSGTVTKTFSITAADISGATIAPIADQTYTGDPLTPPVVVTLEGVTLVEGTDYTVEYSANTEVGTAAVTVIGTGNYTGQVLGSFEIVPVPPIDLSSATVTFDPDTLIYDGTAQKPAPTVVLDGVTLVEGVDYTVTYADNTGFESQTNSEAPATQTATATITGIGAYSGTALGTFTIEPRIEWIWGITQMDTSAEIAKKAYPNGSDTVILAKGDHWADALAGGPLAGLEDAPILLVIGDALAPSVKDAIADLGATNAIILGGERAIRPSIADELVAMGVTPDRIFGTTQYETADAIAKRVVDGLGTAWDGTTIFASGHAPFDALSVSPVAAKKIWPVLLVDRESGTLTDYAHELIAADAITRSIAVGGERAILPSAYAEMPVAERWFGLAWWDTSVEIARTAVASEGFGYSWPAFARGETPYDALAGSTLQAKRNSPLLLVQKDNLPDSTRTLLVEKQAEIDKITYFGGERAIYPIVKDAIEAALGW